MVIATSRTRRNTANSRAVMAMNDRTPAKSKRALDDAPAFANPDRGAGDVRHHAGNLNDEPG